MTTGNEISEELRELLAIAFENHPEFAEILLAVVEHRAEGRDYRGFDEIKETLFER